MTCIGNILDFVVFIRFLFFNTHARVQKSGKTSFSCYMKFMRSVLIGISMAVVRVFVIIDAVSLRTLLSTNQIDPKSAWIQCNYLTDTSKYRIYSICVKTSRGSECETFNKNKIVCRRTRYSM